MFLLAFAETIQLFPDGTLFIHIGLILLMIWVLNRTLFRPINRVIAARERFRGGHNSEAEEIAAQAAEKENRYSGEMLAARSQGYQLIEGERLAAVERRQKLIGDARAKTAAQLETEKRELQQQAAEVRAAIERDADLMADKITSSILKN
ncbi:MAG: hypothetical protein LC734_11820 [Acidobacteria bacterium]|nr:hypothetical protein [Acidobacteriota bacterium]